jgi:hypothetical protein
MTSSPAVAAVPPTIPPAIEPLLLLSLEFFTLTTIDGACSKVCKGETVGCVLTDPEVEADTEFEADNDGEVERLAVENLDGDEV